MKTCLEYALSLLSRRPYSVAKLRQKLAVRYNHDDVDQAIVRVSECGYLCDEKLANDYVNINSK